MPSSSFPTFVRLWLWFKSVRLPNCCPALFLFPAPPAAPSSVSTGKVSATEVELTWFIFLDGGSPVTAIAVNYTATNPVRTDEVLISRTAARYTYRGLSPFVKYSFRIRAQNAVGFSAYSQTVTATTDSAGRKTAYGHLSRSLAVATLLS